MKIILYGEDARRRIKKGIKVIRDAVGSTMGAAGHPVVLQTHENIPFISADGITVSEAVDVEQDPVADVAIGLVKNACREANKSGDGSSASMVLTYAIIEQDEVVKDYSHQLVRKGMELAKRDVIEYLNGHALSIENNEELIDIATISCRGDKEMGEILAKAYEHAGVEGAILLEEGRGTESSVEFITGYQLDKGFYSPIFKNNKKGDNVEYLNPKIIITDISLNEAKDLIKMLERVMQGDTSTPLVIVGSDISDLCLQVLETNVAQGNLVATFVEAPEFGDKQSLILEDLAFVTGATFFSSRKGNSLSDIQSNLLGAAQKFISTNSMSVFINAKTPVEEVNNYSESLNEGSDKEFHIKRKSRLAGRLSKVIVGAKSAVEMREKFDRCEDSKNSVRAALESGYVVGGGKALLKASSSLRAPKYITKAEQAGYNLVLKAIEAPARQILENLYGDEKESKFLDLIGLGKTKVDKIIQRLRESEYWEGYDVKNMEYVDMQEAGIIDPLKVIKSSLEAAFSVGSTILATNCVIAITGDNGDFEIK